MEARGAGRRFSVVVRKTARILREDGGVVLRRRARRYANRRFRRGKEVALPVALDDVLDADWTARQANDGDDGRTVAGPLTINWLIPPIGNGSGGHQNILRFVRFLEKRGHMCRVIVYDGRVIQTAEEAEAIIRRHFPALTAEIRVGSERIADCDALVATAWQTAYPVFNARTRARKFYFVQDYEPYFHAMGTQCVLAENTYRFGLYGITLGGWLSSKLTAEYGMSCEDFNFGSDSRRYVYENGGERKKVVFYARPATPRRGFELGVFALALFAQQNPDYEIHLVGSDIGEYRLPFEFVNRGVVTPHELNALYNEAAAALVVSLTNMSLMPLELLSAGCIPVVNEADNNTRVSDNPFIAYAQPSPQALAQALHDTVNREDLSEYAARAAASARALSWEDAGDKVERILMRGLGARKAPSDEPSRGPTISAVVGAYNSEHFVGETLESILGQTRPPDEVVVVDDGSTDGTAEVLAAFGNAIRVVRQPNGGCPNAFNRAFREARGDYVAMCGADDLWEPRKLEWQVETLLARPEVDVSFGGALVFGRMEGRWPDPPGNGLLDRRELTEGLFADNFICASSIVIRRDLWLDLGPFVERFSRADDDHWSRELGMGPVAAGQRFSGDDYDYWLRALRASAVFHYDPRDLVRYRRHEDNVTTDGLWVRRSKCHLHDWHADQIEDRSLLRSVLADDRFDLGRLMIDAGRPAQARRAFRAALCLKPAPRRLAWALIASLPERPRARLVPALVSAKRSLSGAGGGGRAP